MLSLQVCRSASLQVCKSASLQVCKSASLQVCKSASLQSAFVAHRPTRRVDAQRNDCQRSIFLQERKRQPGNAWDLGMAEKLNHILATVSNQR